MTTWGEAPYFPMKVAPQNVKQDPDGDKRCSKCHHVFIAREGFYSSGDGKYKSACKTCDNASRKARQVARAESPEARAWARARQEKLNGYWIVKDPSGIFIGFIRGYDFKYTLRDGGWPNEMIVRHKGRLFQVMERKLYEIR